MYLMRLSHSVSAFHDNFIFEFQFAVQTGDWHSTAVQTGDWHSTAVQTGDWHSTAVKQAPMFVIPA
jgi:hypothetical protein